MRSDAAPAFDCESYVQFCLKKHIVSGKLEVMEVYIGCFKKLVSLCCTWQSSTSPGLCLAQEVMLSSGALQSSSSCCSLWGPTRKSHCSCSVQAPTHPSDKKAAGVQPGLILTWNRYLIRLSACTENSNAVFSLGGEGTLRSTHFPKCCWWIPASVSVVQRLLPLSRFLSEKTMNKLNAKAFLKKYLVNFSWFSIHSGNTAESKSRCSNNGLKELHSVVLIDQVIVPHCLVSCPSSDNMPILSCYGK